MAEQKRVIPARQQEQLTPEEKVARAQEAQRLLEHANLRLDYFEAFCACAPDKVHERDQIFHAGRVVADVEQHLRVVMTQGKLTQAQIDKVAARSAGRA